MSNTDKKCIRIKELTKLMLKRRTIIAIVSVLTVILFKEQIEIYLSNNIVNGLLSKIKSELKSDVIFIIITAGIIAYAVVRWRKYIPSKGTLSFIVLFGIAYSLYRVAFDVWIFTPYSLFETIKYTDFISVLVLLHMVLTISYYNRAKKSRGKEKSKKENRGFFVDKELTYDEEKEPKDLLGYEGYAEKVADKIGETKLERSFAIGINGKWGMGKSSFMGMIKKNLKEDDKNILIHFNPWNSKTPEAILKDFFDTFHGVIQSEYHSLSRLILRYADKLLDLNRTKSTRFIYMVTSLIFGNKPADVLYSTINNTIKKTDKRFIVFIDDLDRLDAKEIFEVLKIIRNTANFKETVFIVAYDRTYVVKALDNLNKCDSHRYLEKIFQLNIDLPYFNKDILRKELYDCLVDVFSNKSDEFKDELGKELLKNDGIGEKYFGLLFNNVRDIRQFYNSLVLNSSGILDEISIRDFILVQLLKLKWPLVFDMVKIDILKYIEKSKYGKGLVMYLKEDGNSDYLIDKDIKKYREKLLIDESELDNVIKLLHDIFPQVNIEPNISDNSVLYAVKFGLYFSYTLSPYSISEPIFEWVRKGGVNSLFELIDTATANKSVDDLEQKFMRISDFKNIEDFENIIRAIIYLATRYSFNNSYEYKGIVGYERSNLLRKIGRYIDLKDSGNERSKKFIMNILSNANSPYRYESMLSYDFCKVGTATVYDKDELNNIRTAYLEKYCEEVKYFNTNIVHLYTYSKFLNFEKGGETSYSVTHLTSEKARKIFKEFIIKDRYGFIYYLIERADAKHPLPNKFYINRENVLSIYNNLEAFENEFVFTVKEEKDLRLREFCDFYMDFKENEYGPIRYGFKHIPIGEKYNNVYAIIWRNHLEDLKNGIEEVEYKGDFSKVRFTRDEFVYIDGLMLSDYTFSLEIKGENSERRSNTVLAEDLHHVLKNDDSIKDIIKTKHLEFKMTESFLLIIRSMD